MPKRPFSTEPTLPWPSRRDRDDCGFTLLEMVITVAIMAIVVGAIGTAIVTTIGNQQTTNNRVADSSSAQITSAVYVRDVQTATQVTTNMTPSSPTPCGSGVNPGAQFLLGLTWQSGATTTLVSYWQTTTNGISKVSRQLCVGSATPVSTVRAGSGLSGVRVDVSPSSQAVRARADWTSVIGISSITLDAVESATNFPFDLLATPRLTTGNGGGNPEPPPLFLLGNSGPALTCGGNGNLSVIGAMFLDSTTPGSAQLTGHPSVTATQGIYTATTPPATAINGPPGSYSPSPPLYASPVGDPYAGLTPPSTAGLSTFTDGMNHGPGIYTTTLTFAGNSSYVLATGVYILQQGISVSGQANLTSQSAPAGNPQGVLLYVTGGQVSFSGLGRVTLSPLANTTGATPQQPAPYPPPAQNLLIWQASSDSTAISLSGNGNGNVFSGTVYAPTATVGSAGNGSFTAGSVVANSMSCAGNGTETIG